MQDTPFFSATGTIDKIITPIPSLALIFSEFTGVPIILDLKRQKGRKKNQQLVQTVGQLIRQFRRTPHTIVGSFSDLLLLKFRKAFAEIHTGAGVMEVTWTLLLHRCRMAGLLKPAPRSYQLPVRKGAVRVACPSFIQNLRRNGSRVDFWTINSVEIMHQLAKDGATGIITDFPDRAITAFAAGSKADQMPMP